MPFHFHSLKFPENNVGTKQAHYGQKYATNSLISSQPYMTGRRNIEVSGL